MSATLSNVYSQDSEFWDKYRKGRPQAPDSFFERIFAYHAEHGGQFGTVHNAGAGGGVHSEQLAKRFDKVIVTDVSESNIQDARSRLKDPQYEFQTTKLEDTTSFPAASVDLVFAATMLHFTDVDAALKAVAHQLKPGGTFLAVCTGLCRFSKPDIQEAWFNLFSKACGNFIHKIGPAIETAAYYNASAYDYVAIPESMFQPGVLRVKLNDNIHDTPGGWHYFLMIPPWMRERVPAVSRFGKSDKFTFEDDKDWDFEKDINGLREILQSFPFDLEDAEVKALDQKLESVLGAKTVKGHWLVSYILASRK